MATPPPRLLPAVSAAFAPLASVAGGDIGTAAFAEACTSVLPLFDCLGSVFYFAKTELETKRASLVAVQAALPTLAAVVAADVAAGTATTKNSPTRNLHRIITSLAFLADLLRRLAATPAAALRPAASEAYGATLAACHNALLRAGVRASLYLLPDRATFLAAVGEPPEAAETGGQNAGAAPPPSAAAEGARALAADLGRVVGAVEGLFAREGVRMPVSDVRWLPAAAG